MMMIDPSCVGFGGQPKSRSTVGTRGHLFESSKTSADAMLGFLILA